MIETNSLLFKFMSNTAWSHDSTEYVLFDTFRSQIYETNHKLIYNPSIEEYPRDAKGRIQAI